MSAIKRVFHLDYGYYMYIETSAPRRPNDTARLISPVVRGNGTVVTRCVKFYYHMYGPHVNSLSVYTRSNGRYDAPLWRKNGTQGPSWRYGEVQVKTGNSFQVNRLFLYESSHLSWMSLSLFASCKLFYSVMLHPLIYSSRGLLNVPIF